NPGLVWSGVHFMWGCRVAASASAPEKKKYLDFLKLFNKTISSAAIPQQTKTNLEDSCRRFIWLLLKDHPGISLFAEEGDLISRWKISPDPTWGLIVTKLAETDTQAAKSLLLAASIGGDPNYASEVCTALLESPALLAAFQESDWKSSLNKLTEVSKIEDYWIQQALIRCSNLFPLATANFLIQRIQRQETLENSQADYRPLPYLIEDDLKGAFAEIDSSLRIQLLNEAIDLIKNSQRGSLASLLYAEYASLISGQLSSEVRSILGQRGSSSDPSELEAVAVVIQHSYPDFALDHAGIVDTLLTSAKKISNETLRRVRSCLSAGAHTRSISRQFGEPSKAHIQMRDRAAEIKRQFFPNSPTYEFYADLEKSAQWDIDREVERDAEVLDE
ncbi:MAG: hypothetical protein HY547_00800, partial [Elusimicrobia bacterium]|nr:hypothetical protein [Elusimicrobiota bacterium]